MAVSTYNL